MDAVNRRTEKRRFEQIPDFCCTKRRRFPGNVLKIFTLGSKVVEGLVASSPEMLRENAHDNVIEMADAWKKAHEDTDNAPINFEKLARAIGKTKVVYAKKAYRFCNEQISGTVLSYLTLSWIFASHLSRVARWQKRRIWQNELSPLLQSCFQLLKIKRKGGASKRLLAEMGRLRENLKKRCALGWCVFTSLSLFKV